VARARTSFRRAVRAHREALGLLDAVRARLGVLEQESDHSAQSVEQQTMLAAQLDRAAAASAPGWLGAPWDVISRDRFPAGVEAVPGDRVVVRIGDGAPLPGVGFGVVIPLIGAGHLVIEPEARDPAVLGLLRALLSRLLAAFQPGALRVLAVDGGALGAPFAPFRALVQAEVMSNPVTEAEGFRQVLDVAEEQVRRVQDGAQPDPDVLLIVAAALPPGCGRTEYARLAALAHAGPAARVHLVLAGYPPENESAWSRQPPLENTTFIARHPSARGAYRLSDPPGAVLSRAGRGLNVPIVLDPEPPSGLLTELCRAIAAQADDDRSLDFDDLIPAELWTESSVTGLSTVIGRAGRSPVRIALDDATPHWLVGGRTGSGKTVFLLDVLYGLAARYSPDELALYLLDFKEGVSFTEFVPTDRDPTWVPHARTVGVESDREYGLAVLRELVKEMGRRATAMKQSGVTNLAQLRAARAALALPRILAVIDEFHVLFQGSDKTAKDSAALLEEIARKGRSYGVHLVLASQAVSGIDALLGKGKSVFGQFGMRVALAGGGTVLAELNSAADNLPRGVALLNDAGGAKTANRTIAFPDADAHSIALLRHRLWTMRTPGSTEPSVFIGYAEQILEKDPDYLRLTSQVRRRSAMVGRLVDIGLSTARVPMDPVPGAHLAVIGTSAVGADVLHAAALSLAEQHDPDDAEFLLAALVPAVDDVVDEVAAHLARDGYAHEVSGVAGYRDWVTRLARPGRPEGRTTYLVVFGADAASSLLQQKAEGANRTGLEEFRTLLRDGPMRNVHVIGWWRGVRRLTEDVGLAGRDDVGNLLALNIRGEELSSVLMQFSVDWTPRPNRGLLLSRSEDTRHLVVPFVRPGRLDQE
jgi:DNA segregation ATPase FtsK/SpoIIIE, S-DNA-T family